MDMKQQFMSMITGMAFMREAGRMSLTAAAEMGALWG